MAGADRLSDGIDAKDYVRRCILTLAPREERVLRLRFGLGGVGEHTLDEIGEMLSLSGSQIRNIEKKALRKLRHKARRTWSAGSVQTHDQPLRTNRKQAVQRHKGEGFDTGDDRRTRLYREWQAERDAALANGTNIDTVSDRSDIETGTREGSRGLRKLFRATAYAISGLACFVAWGYAVDVSAKEAFNLNFGHQDGPIVRLLVWMVGLVCAPFLVALARFEFEDWYDCRRLAFRNAHKK
ncbi:MAG: sigma factor-like helix-turn-helix DNA-binding protein [Methylococcales bacterium]